MVLSDPVVRAAYLGQDSTVEEGASGEIQVSMPEGFETDRLESPKEAALELRGASLRATERVSP